MENSEIPRSALENPEGLREDEVNLDKGQQLEQAKSENSGSKNRDVKEAPRKNRARSAKKESRKEVGLLTKLRVSKWSW